MQSKDANLPVVTRIKGLISEITQESSHANHFAECPVCSELLAQVAGLVNQQPLLEMSRQTLVILTEKAKNQEYLSKCIKIYEIKNKQIYASTFVFYKYLGKKQRFGKNKKIVKTMCVSFVRIVFESLKMLPS